MSNFQTADVRVSVMTAGTTGCRETIGSAEMERENERLNVCSDSSAWNNHRIAVEHAMKGYIEIPEIPNACIECKYHENYKCHGFGEYDQKYAPEVWRKPIWCPIKYDFKADDTGNKRHP